MDARSDKGDERRPSQRCGSRRHSPRVRAGPTLRTERRASDGGRFDRLCFARIRHAYRLRCLGSVRVRYLLQARASST